MHDSDGPREPSATKDALMRFLEESVGVFTPDEIEAILRHGLGGIAPISDADERTDIALAVLNDHRHAVHLHGNEAESRYFAMRSFADSEHRLNAHAAALAEQQQPVYAPDALETLIDTKLQKFIDKKRNNVIEKRLAYEAARHPDLAANEAAWETFENKIRAEETANYLITADEFRDVARGVFGGRGLSIVIGPPGAKKSTLIAFISRYFETSADGQTAGLAVAAPGSDQAASLRDDVDGPVTTLPELLNGFENGEPPVGAGGMILLDEAGMVGSRAMETLFRHAAENRIRLVLFGDDKQLPSNDPGFPLADLVRHHPATVTELTNVFRQIDPKHREATQSIRQGDAAAAYTLYAEEDYGWSGMADPAIPPEEEWPRGLDATVAAAAGRLAALYDQAKASGEAFLGITQSETAADAINRQTHEILLAAGRLEDPIAVDGPAGQKRFASGDNVVLRQHLVYQTSRGKFRTIPAGTRGTVKDTREGAITVRYDGKASPKLTHEAADLPALDYGYATSLYAFQGGKRDAIVDVTTGPTNRAEKLVGLSRHTKRLYHVIDAEVYPDLDALSAAAATMPAQPSTLAAKRNKTPRPPAAKRRQPHAAIG